MSETVLPLCPPDCFGHDRDIYTLSYCQCGHAPTLHPEDGICTGAKSSDGTSPLERCSCRNFRPGYTFKYQAAVAREKEANAGETQQSEGAPLEITEKLTKFGPGWRKVMAYYTDILDCIRETVGPGHTITDGCPPGDPWHLIPRSVIDEMRGMFRAVISSDIQQAECRLHHCNSCREDEDRCCPCGSCTFYKAQQAEARVHSYDPAYDAVFPYPNFVCKTHHIANRESGMGSHINDPKCHVVIEWPNA